VFGSTIVYVIAPRGVNDPVTLFVAERVAGELTVAPAVLLPFPPFGSPVDDAIVAVLEIVVPALTLFASVTSSVNIAEPGAKLAFEHVTVPAAPTAGVVHDQPAAAESEANVVLGGSVSVHDAVVAALGPALDAVIV
jgi:hypothetical protein